MEGELDCAAVDKLPPLRSAVGGTVVEATAVDHWGMGTDTVVLSTLPLVALEPLLSESLRMV